MYNLTQYFRHPYRDNVITVFISGKYHPMTITKSMSKLCYYISYYDKDDQCYVDWRQYPATLKDCHSMIKRILEEVVLP